MFDFAYFEYFTNSVTVCVCVQVCVKIAKRLSLGFLWDTSLLLCVCHVDVCAYVFVDLDWSPVLPEGLCSYGWFKVPAVRLCVSVHGC